MAPRGDLSDSQFVTAAGVRVHYKEVGEGYPVICLHGAGPGANSESNFRRNVGALSERFRAMLVDMPQFGKSEKIPIEEGRLGFNARVLDAFMAETGIERAHYIGNSMGGQVALKLAIDKPGRVDRLVVLGVGAINNPIFVPSPLEGIKLIARYYKGEGPTREKLRELLETLVYDSSFLTDEVVEERFRTTIEPDNLELFARLQGPVQEGGSLRRPRRHRVPDADRLGDGRPVRSARCRSPDDPAHAARADARLLALRPLGAGRARRGVQPPGAGFPVGLRSGGFGMADTSADTAPDPEGDFASKPWAPYLKAALGFRNHWYPACFSREIAEGECLGRGAPWRAGAVQAHRRARIRDRGPLRPSRRAVLRASGMLFRQHGDLLVSRLHLRS